MKINEGKFLEVSENVVYYFYVELILSMLLILFSYLIYFKFGLIISIPLTIYNIYSFFKGNYKLDFRIGDALYNQKIYNQVSLRNKIKFSIYLILFIVSFITIIVNILQFLFEALFHDLDNY